jgi:hypothetical protein
MITEKEKAEVCWSVVRDIILHELDGYMYDDSIVIHRLLPGNRKLEITKREFMEIMNCDHNNLTITFAKPQ